MILWNVSIETTFFERISCWVYLDSNRVFCSEPLKSQFRFDPYTFSWENLGILNQTFKLFLKHLAIEARLLRNKSSILKGFSIGTVLAKRFDEHKCTILFLRSTFISNLCFYRDNFLRTNMLLRRFGFGRTKNIWMNTLLLKHGFLFGPSLRLHHN